LKKGILLLSFVVLSACQNNSKLELNQLNGYWEIDFVKQENETFQNKQSNPLYDFYSMKDGKGIYKKVAPQLDGSFLTSESSIPFEIIEDNGTFKIQFNSPWNVWEKTIKQLDSQKLVLFHQDRSFFYKRPLTSKSLEFNE
jgi:hypothetical protein